MVAGRIVSAEIAQIAPAIQIVQLRMSRNVIRFTLPRVSASR
jgi:hypothetical protein